MLEGVVAQESAALGLLFSVDKLQVGEVKPKVFSTKAELLLWLTVLLIKSMAVGATDPGVRVGSSSGFFNPGPFHGLPGSNSGMPKVSMPLRVSALFALEETLLTTTEPTGAT